MVRALSILIALALPLAAACGGAARTAPAPRAEPRTATPAGNGSQEASPDETASVGDSAPPSAMPEEPAIERTPVADTPMCRAYKAVVEAASGKFSSITAEELPGAASCKVVSGGPGQSAVATYTCEYASAEDRAELEPRHEELEESLRECGAHAALDATRVRIVEAAKTLHLVVNVHDHARWR